jgi:hypothetical protein
MVCVRVAAAPGSTAFAQTSPSHEANEKYYDDDGPYDDTWVDVILH